MIKLNNIYKTYAYYTGEISVLKKLNFELKAGEFVAIIGESGSGKSTLLNIIGLLDKNFEGSYFFNESEISNLSNNQIDTIRRNNVGFIFQDFKLLNNYSVLENIIMPLTYRNINRKQAYFWADNLIESLGLIKLKNKSPKLLSGGQKQRVAIARAIISKPKLIIADEPTGALDKKNAINIIRIISKLSKQINASVVMVTHDLYIASLADKTLVLENRRLTPLNNISKKE
ncbi:ABC transporter ATP-binding protein [Lactobacillus iners]|uniref:ABC transporter ATP-binding protein n=1 Tax=Lactobacillus iners TaxID=147802 RepID=UPI003EBC02B7|nr:ABC transporter ATP-binding protein [Lactobacillus iners]MCT7893250.1 ABC transporter ATP-binding protein [Lactobacillus iners]